MLPLGAHQIASIIAGQALIKHSSFHASFFKSPAIKRTLCKPFFIEPIRIPIRTMATKVPSSTTSLPPVVFKDIVTHRHSVYAIEDKLPAPLDDTALVSMVKDTLAHVPSAFNSQTTRIVLLVKADHKKFWEHAANTTLPKVPEDQRDRMKGRIDMFAAAYGSILFLEDTATIAASKERNKMIAHMFDEWSDHTSGMHQFVLWTALESFDGVGANLQHYSFDPECEAAIKKEWDMPSEWKLKAQLVFGGVKEGAEWPGQKEKLPSSTTMRAYGTDA